MSTDCATASDKIVVFLTTNVVNFAYMLYYWYHYINLCVSFRRLPSNNIYTYTPILYGIPWPSGGGAIMA
jgi:hypothetical protein